MRIALLIAASVLVAGCSSGARDGVEASSALTTTTPSASSTPAPTTVPRPPAATAAPVPGAAIAEVVAWIEAGRPADPGGYRTMTRDGTSTPLGDQVAFITAGTEANCVTNRYQDGALACLVKLTNPPPRPPDFPTAWKDNWVDYDGTRVDVGSAHGDPGPFVDGTGAQLPDGASLAFGDYRCRADAVGLFCANYAHQTAIRLSAAGIQPFGCLAKVTPPPTSASGSAAENRQPTGRARSRTRVG